MKIGILTFHFGINYGGVLQCLALQNKLIGMGHDVEVINYIPTYFKHSSFFRIGGIRKEPFIALPKIYIKWKYSSKITTKFETFRNQYLKRSERVDLSTISSIANKYDAIIVGSDQIWNPSSHKDLIYFLGFKLNPKIIRISYAPCCAYNFVLNENKMQIKKALEKFDSISVRNIETYNFVKDNIGISAPILADPTLLYNFNELINNTDILESYILVYIIGKEIKGGHKMAINEIKKRYSNEKVYSIILSENHPQYFPWSDKTFYTADPKDWVNLIANAKFVYTDSFHGVLFSLKFQKPFLAYYSEKNRASRFIDLKERYKLEQFIIEESNDIQKKKSLKNIPDYNMINRLINIHTLNSVNFIQKSLEKIKDK